METITLNGHTMFRSYCLCGYEYKVTDHDTHEDFVYELGFHNAVHSDVNGWDIASMSYYLDRDPTWRKLQRIRG